MPVVAGLGAAGDLELAASVTLLIVNISSGKPTLVEAVAVAAGFNPDGGSRKQPRGKPPGIATKDRNTTHWLENRGTIPAVEISVDIVVGQE